jgi:RNA polymerase sigma-70 factor (sigma-E family)
MADVATGGAVPRDDLFALRIVVAEADVPMRSPTLCLDVATVVMTELHRAHYGSLVAFAGLYLGAVADAEDAVQGAYVEVWNRWHGIKDPDKALLYLRRAVFNKAKSHLRHRQVVDRHPPSPPESEASGEECALGHLTDERIVAAIRSLPSGQQDCVVLRFGLDLSEKETARILKVSIGTVKKQLSRAKERLSPILEDLRND